MSASLARLLDRFQPDEWRQANGFSLEMESVHKILFANEAKADEKVEAINRWMQKYQPCLFGRAAASQHAIRYCLISEKEVRDGDETVRRRIQDSHLSWTRESFEARSSNFVLIVVSERVANAIPNSDVMEFAKILAGLYLQEDSIEPDRIYHDAAFLAVPAHRERVLKWKAGVNYFSAHGDKRWWQDHRIPGGLGFSSNSVGHFAKSGKLLSALDKYLVEIGMPPDDRQGPRIDSLAKALTIAMQTIENASNAVSGKATELLPLPRDLTELPVPTCPFKLPPKLEDKNFCAYRGYYHTDFTLPSEYFRPEIERPAEIKPFEDLDFTYLFDPSPDNAAHQTMGEGVPIRSDFVGNDAKRGRMSPAEVSISDEPALRRALEI